MRLDSLFFLTSEKQVEYLIEPLFASGIVHQVDVCIVEKSTAR